MLYVKSKGPCSQDPTTCPCPDPDESSPFSHTVSLRSILIYPPPQSVGFPRGHFLRFYSQHTVCISLLHYVCHMIHPSHHPWYDLYINIWQWVQIMNFSLCSFILFPVTSSLLGTNISQPLVLKHSSYFVILLVWQQATQHWAHICPVAFSLKNSP